MSRFWIVVVVVVIVCGLLLLFGVASAQQVLLFVKKVVVIGSKGFMGIYMIDCFISKGGKVYSVGTIRGKVKGTKCIMKENVRMLVGVGIGVQFLQVLLILGVCQVLNLVFGLINFNLLGFVVCTNQINLCIDVVLGVGNLLW